MAIKRNINQLRDTLKNSDKNRSFLVCNLYIALDP